MTKKYSKVDIKSTLLKTEQLELVSAKNDEKTILKNLMK